jgi:hypothetical protein
VTAARAVGQAQPSGASGAGTGLDWPMATASLPVAAAMAGGVQPRGRDGVELPCMVCGVLFTARRADRRTCSPACARRDRAGRTAAKLQRLGVPALPETKEFRDAQADSARVHLRARRRRGR